MEQQNVYLFVAALAKIMNFLKSLTIFSLKLRFLQTFLNENATYILAQFTFFF